MQKFIQLKYNSNHLIDNIIMFKRIRNTNYLENFLIYLGFSMLAEHLIPIAALSLFIIIIWIPNMIKKDKSLSKYDKFQDYKKYKFTISIYMVNLQILQLFVLNTAININKLLLQRMI